MPASAYLSEDELTHWWRFRALTSLDRGGDADADDALLFLVGALCARAGQSAVFETIYAIYMQRFSDDLGGGHFENASEFLTRMTAAASAGQLHDLC